jgi:hypothetical protein
MSAELAVSISDFLLAGFSGTLAWRLRSRPTQMRRTRRWFAIVLGAIAFSSLLGAISHGFVPENASRLGGLIWRVTLMFLGPAALGLSMLASLLLFRPGTIERARSFCLIALAVYVGVILFEYQKFVFALAFYTAATLLLLAGFVVHWRQRQSFASDGIVAMIVTLLAALLQYLQVGIHPVYFNHNALYQLIQAVALFFLYRAGMKWISGAPDHPIPLRPRPAS